MNMHNPVCLSPHCFGAFISQRGGIFHPQPAGFYSGSLAGLRLGLDLFFFFEIEILKNTCVGNLHGQISSSALLSLADTSSATWLM